MEIDLRNTGSRSNREGHQVISEWESAQRFISVVRDPGKKSKNGAPASESQDSSFKSALDFMGGQHARR